MSTYQYTPCSDGITGSEFPIYEWWAFGQLYKEINWSNWAMQNKDAYIEFHREDGSKTEVKIHIYDNQEAGLPLLQDAARYFNVKKGESVSFYDKFQDRYRNGTSYLISVK